MAKIGLLSFMHESNSFNKRVTTINLFEVHRGAGVVEEWRDAHHEIGGMLAKLSEEEQEAVPLLTAWAQPAGPVEQGAFEQILNEILERLASETLDGLLVALHGAMVAEHDRDPDGLILEQIRETVGEDIPVVLTLDLHANVSSRMISNVDATTIYRTYPHLDQRERGREAAGMLLKILDGKIRPVQYLEKPPLQINILAQSTDRRPASELFQLLRQVLRDPAIVSGSIALGFPYGDAEKLGSSFLVVADGDLAAARRGAKLLGRTAWDLRARVNVTGVPIEQAVRKAARARERPVTLLDVGDNIGGGSPGDGTVIFGEILNQGLENALVVLCDPDAVRDCQSRESGSTVTLMVGGKSDSEHGPPVLLQGKIQSIHDGLFEERQPRHGGKQWNDQGPTAVIETSQGHTVVLNSKRMAPFSLEQILSLGIQPGKKTVLVAKGAIAPRAAYEPISAEMIEVDSPGITCPNPARFAYRFRRQPLFPFEEDAEYSPRGEG